MPSSKSGPGSRSAAPRKALPGKAGTAQDNKRTPNGSGGGGSVYFEFIPAGASVRVTAIDERTGREATIIGPANAGRATLERVALSKLRYVLSRPK